MAYNMFLVGVILIPGIVSQIYYEIWKGKEPFTYTVAFRILLISLFAYGIRGLIGIQQGHGESHVFIYFDNVDNIVKYMLLSVVSGFLLINTYMFLEGVLQSMKQKFEKGQENDS